MNYKRLVCFLLVCIMVLSMCTTAFGATTVNREHEEVISGIHGDIGYVNWRVRFILSGTYDNPQNPYVLTEISASAYLTPEQTSIVGNGSFTIASVKKTIDYSDVAILGIAPSLNSVWEPQSVIIGGNTHKYFAYKADANDGPFYRQARLTGNYYFSSDTSMVTDPNIEFVATIYGPTA